MNYLCNTRRKHYFGFSKDSVNVHSLFLLLIMWECQHDTFPRNNVILSVIASHLDTVQQFLSHFYEYIPVYTHMEQGYIYVSFVFQSQQILEVKKDIGIKFSLEPIMHDLLTIGASWRKRANTFFNRK